jgi:hypothetical protein
MTANSGNNSLDGSVGDDTLNGLGGADTMVGFEGNDTYFVDNLGDQVVEQPGQGDDTVKRNVIAKYLQAEEQSQQDPSIAVTPENYKFKYKGRALLDGRETHRFEVTPKKKRQGLYRGQLWIDTETFLRVQESGRLVKNPSIMLRKVEFVRKYEIRDGVSVPRQMQTVAQTWLVGKAELTVDYSNYSFETKRASLTDGDDQ